MIETAIRGIADFAQKYKRQERLMQITDAFSEQDDPEGALVLKGLEVEQTDLFVTLDNILDDSFPGLDVSNNRLEGLPENIDKLWALETLTATNNQLKTLPDELGTLKELMELYLNSNQLKALPKRLKSLRTLEILDLSDNKFQVFPEGVVKLSKLRELKLSDNAIGVLPKGIKDCEKLEVLDLSNNYLTELPEGFLEALPNLRELNLENNPLSQAARAALRPFQDTVKIKVGFVVPSYRDPVSDDPVPDEAIDLEAMTTPEVERSDEEVYKKLMEGQETLRRPLLGGALKPIGRPKLS